jgi:hypothetical protein
LGDAAGFSRGAAVAYWACVTGIEVDSLVLTAHAAAEGRELPTLALVASLP